MPGFLPLPSRVQPVTRSAGQPVSPDPPQRAWRRPEARAIGRSMAARTSSSVPDQDQTLPGPGHRGVEQLPGQEPRVRRRQEKATASNWEPWLLCTVIA